MLKFLFILLAMVLLAVSAAWVSFQGAPAPLPNDAQNRGTFTFSDTTEPGNLDPGKTSALIDFRIIKCLYQTLMVYEFGGEGLEPGGAESYDISPDGRVYTFKLRRESRWSDGEPVTAHDYLYAWRRAMLFETGADYAALFYLIEGGEAFNYWRAGLLDFDGLDGVVPEEGLDQFIADHPDLKRQCNELDAEEKRDLTYERFAQTVGVKALDDYTLEVTLNNPTAYFIELCAFPTFSPVPEHVIEQHTTLDEESGTIYTDAKYWGDPDDLVTNGAYTLSFWQHNQRLVLDQNPEYWDKDSMGNIRIVQRIIPNETLALLLFQHDEIDWIASISQPELRSKLVDDEYAHAHIVPNAGVYYYQFNCREERNDGRPNPFVDVRMRRALAMCIDRQKIVDYITRNNEPVAMAFVPEGQIPGYLSPVNSGVDYDPQGARELLAEAGYPGGAGLDPITLLINTSGTSAGANEKIAIVIKKIWEDELGLVVTLENPEFQVYLEASKQGNFDVRRAGWFGDYRDPTTWLDMLKSGDSNNDADYQNPEFDGLLAAASVEPDPERRLEILHDAEALLLEDAPITPIYNYVSLMIYDASRVEMGENSWNNMRLDLIEVQRD